ncbi:MAG TPA: ATP-binding cassette domain-containing protein, partial [Burkholderiaceae bacterium]|nr:ATP-binding cassette domain-containing protein [Burkholderiaceae bacterium]
MTSAFAGSAGAGQPDADVVARYLRLIGIRKDFGAFTALSNIDLEIAKGEFVCFLGPSGCGKTTLLRVIAGLERPDSGALLLDGKDLA